MVSRASRGKVRGFTKKQLNARKMKARNVEQERRDQWRAERAERSNRDEN
jgi:hypothetical protein